MECLELRKREWVWAALCNHSWDSLWNNTPTSIVAAESIDLCLLLATKTVAVPGAFFLSQLAASLGNKSSASAVNGPTSVRASQLDLLQHPNLDLSLAWCSQIFKKSTSLTFHAAGDWNICCTLGTVGTAQVDLQSLGIDGIESKGVVTQLTPPDRIKTWNKSLWDPVATL